MLQWFQPDAKDEYPDRHEPVPAEVAATNPVRSEPDDDAEDGEDGDEGGSSQNLKILTLFMQLSQ